MGRALCASRIYTGLPGASAETAGVPGVQNRGAEGNRGDAGGRRLPDLAVLCADRAGNVAKWQLDIDKYKGGMA